MDWEKILAAVSWFMRHVVGDINQTPQVQVRREKNPQSGFISDINRNTKLDIAAEIALLEENIGVRVHPSDGSSSYNANKHAKLISKATESFDLSTGVKEALQAVFNTLENRQPEGFHAAYRAFLDAASAGGVPWKETRDNAYIALHGFCNELKALKDFTEEAAKAHKLDKNDSLYQQVQNAHARAQECLSALAKGVSASVAEQAQQVSPGPLATLLANLTPDALAKPAQTQKPASVSAPASKPKKEAPAKPKPDTEKKVAKNEPKAAKPKSPLHGKRGEAIAEMEKINVRPIREIISAFDAPVYFEEVYKMLWSENQHERSRRTSETMDDFSRMRIQAHIGAYQEALPAMQTTLDKAKEGMVLTDSDRNAVRNLLKPLWDCEADVLVQLGTEVGGELVRSDIAGEEGLKPLLNIIEKLEQFQTEIANVRRRA